MLAGRLVIPDDSDSRLSMCGQRGDPSRRHRKDRHWTFVVSGNGLYMVDLGGTGQTQVLA